LNPFVYYSSKQQGESQALIEYWQQNYPKILYYKNELIKIGLKVGSISNINYNRKECLLYHELGVHCKDEPLAVPSPVSFTFGDMGKWVDSKAITLKKYS